VSSRVSRSLPVTPLRRYYAALLALTEQEQTELAETHAEYPWLLARRFRLSITALNDEPEIDKSFYPPGRTDPSALPPRPTDQIRSTIQFAKQLCDRRPRTVVGAKELGFRYVDRELSPLRTTDLRRAARRSLDLLLANAHDRTPIFAELKIRGDKLPYFALVQALMLSAEFLVPSQRVRLSKHFPEADLAWSEQGPFADVYVIAFDPPSRGRYRERSLRATEHIACRLAEDVIVSQYVRRFAYLDAFVKKASLVFEKRFAFGPSD
jgi:hypothetical protein